MAANGNAGDPLWLTEVGAPTDGPDGVGTAARPKTSRRRSPMRRRRAWIAALYIYTYEDSGTDTSTDEDWFGLLNADGSAKPAWSAVAAAIG